MSDNMGSIFGATILWHWLFMYTDSFNTNDFHVFVLTIILGYISGTAVSDCNIKSYDFSKSNNK